MNFSHDTELTLRAGGALVNSNQRTTPTTSPTWRALDGYLEWGWTGRRDRDADELAAVHRLRGRIGCIWDAAEDEEAHRRPVNALLGDTHAAPWLTRGTGDAGMASAPGIHPRSAGPADGAEMAMALADPDPRRRTAAAEDLRRAGLRGGARRPVPKPVADLLRHRQLRQPPARRGLPERQAAGGLELGQPVQAHAIEPAVASTQFAVVSSPDIVAASMPAFMPQSVSRRQNRLS